MTAPTTSSSNAVADPVIADIEEFMGEKAQPLPLLLKKGKIYDSKADLLQRLVSDTKKEERTVATPSTSRKRKADEKPATSRDKRAAKGDEKAKRGRGRPRKPRDNEARAKERVLVMSHTCRTMRLASKKACSVVVHREELRKARCSYVRVQSDAQILSNVAVKREVLDLTGDEGMVYLRMNFARITEFATEYIEHFTVRYPYIRAEEVYGVASALTPEVCFDVYQVLRVYGGKEDETECATRALHFLYRYFKVQEMSKKIEDALDGMKDCFFETELQDDYEILLSFSVGKITSLSSEIVSILSPIVAENFNIGKFLRAIASKLNRHYKLDVTLFTLRSAFYKMLKLNGDKCNNRVLQELSKPVPTEEEKPGIGMTEEQIALLSQQIRQFQELMVRQEELAAALPANHSGDTSDSFPDIGVQVKAELIDNWPPPLEVGIKQESGEVIVLD